MMRTRAHRTLTKKARSALIWAAAYFVVLQLAGSLLFDYVWTAVRFPSAAQVLIRLEQRGKNPDIVCLGSSRFGAGINESEIGWELQQRLQLPSRPEVFNASVP